MQCFSGGGGSERHLQGGQRFGLTARKIMRSAVSSHAKLMEEITNLARRNAFEIQTSQQIGLRLVDRSIETSLGRDQLRQHLTELAELNEAGAGIVPEVALRQRTESHELGVVLRQESKIRG
jgi:hypothetical protein